jgi:hypothetical protein
MDIWLVVNFNLTIEYCFALILPYERLYNKGEKWYVLTISFTYPCGVCPNTVITNCLSGAKWKDGGDRILFYKYKA